MMNDTTASIFTRITYGHCKEIAQNRRLIAKMNFEGRASYEAALTRVRSLEEYVVRAANKLIERASHG